MSIITKNLASLGKVSIKPYVDPTKENMGLENYNYVVFPRTYQVESLAAIEQNGKMRYLNGLNEFAPEVKAIKDPEKREAVIKDIRETVSILERERAFNVIDPEDKDFWSKVTMFKPDNQEIWGNITLRLGNDDMFLDPANNADHLIIIKAIEGNGFSLVAPSYEDCKRTNKKWYLDRQIDTMSTKISTTKLKNKALAILQELFDEEPRKLFYIAKNIDSSSVQYTNKTLSDIIYDNLDKYINGFAHEADKKKCANTFIETAKLGNDELKIKAVIRDASFYKYISPKADGVLYETSQNIMLGRNNAEVLEFLKNPVNEDVLDTIMAKVELNWSK